MIIQWFPGHMAKARKIISENLKLVDVVVDVLDARIPKSSKNPEIVNLAGSKPIISALNKYDLADPKICGKWEEYYRENNMQCVFVNSKSGNGINDLTKIIIRSQKEKIERQRQRGRIFKPVRVMIVGIPNSGKSTLINKITGRATAATGDKPGITRGKQWVKINENIELLDTPGILWPKFEDQITGIRLAVTGAIKDEVTDSLELCVSFLQLIKKYYPDAVYKRYGIEISDDENNEKKYISYIEAIGKKRGFLLQGGNVDLDKTSKIVLDEFRSGKFGRITLELPYEEEGLL